MIINRQKHWQFIEDELKAQNSKFKEKFLTSAKTLLTIKRELFVAQFVSFKNGEMIMKFPLTRSLPRKGEHFECMVLPPELQDYHKWDNKTYRDMHSVSYATTECVCIWHSPTSDPRISLVGFSGVSIDFAQYIQKSPGIILAFGPQKPPLEYLMNLQRLVKDDVGMCVSSVLDADYQQKEWEPILINHDNVVNFVYTQLSLSDTMILEGPPGTGKTTMIARLCARLCREGKSVLVVALTNRALMEVAEKKDDVQHLLNDHKIFKTNITEDEIKDVGQLEPIEQIDPKPGSIILSTFFVSSEFASNLVFEQPFDYVIMDEGSQAFLSMFAACKKMGKKNLWVGDTHQQMPIVELNEDIVSQRSYEPLINGFQTLADSCYFPIYQLTTAYRFGVRAASYTGMFYGDSLVAQRPMTFDDLPSLSKVLNIEGGPSLIMTDMPSGDKSPSFGIWMAAFIVGMILQDDKTKKIAVLTCLKDTTAALQMAIANTVGSNKELVVDTVARVQGLTKDITIFFIPDYSYLRTLEPHLFNVATSRAIEHTIIIVDKYVLDCSTLSPIVKRYLERLKSDRCIYVPDPNHGLNRENGATDYRNSIAALLLPDKANYNNT